MKIVELIDLIDCNEYHSVGDGWLILLRKMAYEIKEYIELNYPDSVAEEFTFTQIKEKFGELRVYFYPYFEELDDIVDKYVKISARTCEVCGNPGKIRSDGYWLMARCDKHGPKD